MFGAYLGEKYDHIYPIEDHQVFRLGWGSEAESMRVVSDDESIKPFTRKIFNQDEDSQFGSEGSRDRELKRLFIMKEIMSDCSRTKTCFDLIQILGVEEDNIIDFRYIPGRTLDWLVKEKTIPLKVKNIFRDKYAKFSMKIISEIKDKYGDRARGFKVSAWGNRNNKVNTYFITIYSDDKMLRAGHEKETKIWLKPDNILINPISGVMTLIDPY